MKWLGKWNNNLYHGILNFSLDLFPTHFLYIIFYAHMAYQQIQINDEKLKSVIWYIKITVFSNIHFVICS